MSDNQKSFGQTLKDIEPIGQMSVGHISFSPMSVGQISVSPMSVSPMSVSQMSVSPKSVSQKSVCQKSVSLVSFDCWPVGHMFVGHLGF
jgi:hypothetical protein